MSRASPEPVAIAILAKAPVPGFAKTRLIPELGAHGAAALQDALTEHTARTAVAAGTGPVTLWGAPDITHASFRALATALRIALCRQPAGDLGARMLAAGQAAGRPVLVIGTDCPALTAAHLAKAAQALRTGCDVCAIPAEDGGYVLIGLRTPQPALFEGIAWGGPAVMAQTRARIAGLNLRSREFAPLWDIDRPDDLARLRGNDDFARFF
ncbi:MAG: TIGR04282 family arsenosugar biosynthesis glycosyltransferase [Pseudorhodoplanes sp.]|nr:TIGR04282 family arsenosugar biosynthesis glycosyltransferase [Pseudorhodoplanes sp.]